MANETMWEESFWEGTRVLVLPALPREPVKPKTRAQVVRETTVSHLP